MYIAIEGVKGVGKSSVIQYLSQEYTNYQLLFLHPTHPMPSNHILEILFPLFKYIDFYRAYLYNCRSNYHAKHIDWHDNHLIISDRGIITSLSIRWHKYADKMDYFSRIRQKEYVIQMPDIIIQLHLPENELLTRYHCRQRSYGKHEENKHSLRQISNNLIEINHWLKQPNVIHYIGKEINWIDIDCHNKTVENVANDILQIIEKYMPTPRIHDTNNMI